MKSSTVVLLVALCLSTPAAPGASQAGAGAAPARQPRGETDIHLHPSALIELIDHLGGRQVTLSRVKVVSVINPRAFLIESGGPLPGLPGRMNRVIVLVDDGALTVDAETLVGATVRIAGTARTVLGMQVTREVPWPPELTRDIVRRYEIRAAILSSVVETPDGVVLTRALPAPSP